MTMCVQIKKGRLKKPACCSILREPGSSRKQQCECSCVDTDTIQSTLSRHIYTTARFAEVPIFWWIALGSQLFLPGAGGSCVRNPVRMRGMRSPDVAQIHSLPHITQTVCTNEHTQKNNCLQA